MLSMSAENLTKRGNLAVRDRKFDRAVELYTRAIEAAGMDDAVAAGILTKRSGAYLSLEELQKALDDAKQAMFRLPDHPHNLAIEHATDDAARARYEAAKAATAQEAVQFAEARQDSVPQWDRVRSHDDPQLWFNKLKRAQQAGLVLGPRSGLLVSQAAWLACDDGMRALDKQFGDVLSTGSMVVRPFDKLSLSNIVDCILTDERGFHFPKSTNTKVPLSMPAKLGHMVMHELEESGNIEYSTGSVWLARDIIDDLDSQIETKGRQKVRINTASLIRSRIIGGFLHGPSIESYRQAVALLDEGNRKWAHELLDDRGNTFSPSLVRNTRMKLMQAIMNAHQNAKTDAAKRAFKLDDIEALANQVLANLPTWEATAALAYCAAARAREPVTQLGYRAQFANIPEARRAGDLYDRAIALTPDDWHGQRNFMWAALEMHLRAGGLTAEELIERVQEARRVDDETSRFFPPLAVHPSRELALFALSSVLPVIHDPSSGMGRNTTLKPIPSVFVRRGGNPGDAITQREWEEYEGELGLMDMIQEH
ncbi:hypothetical protein JCM10449v2_001366 [Rhodotorula kratochvilovae]